MDQKELPSFDSLDTERNTPNYLQHERAATETIDLNLLIEKEIADPAGFNIGSEIWATTFGKVLQALPIPVLLIDESRQVLAANQACRKIGAGYEMRVGKPFSQLLAHPSDVLQSESLVSTVLSSRRTAVWEAVLKIDDNTMWARLTFRAIRIRDQKFLLILIEDLSLEKKKILRDMKYKEALEKRVNERTEDLRKLNEQLLAEIADRKRSEEALRESELRFRSVFENDHVVMLIVDPETGRIEDASPRACTFYGYSREELKSKNISQINTLPPGQVLERMQMAKAQQRRYFDFQHLLANGEIRDVEVCTGPIVTGGRTFLLSVIKDMTRHKAMEASLRSSEEKYRSLFDESRDGVYAVLRKGEITDANPAFLEIFGYTREETIGKDIRELYVDPADRTKFQEEIEKKGFVKDYETKFRKKDGRAIDCLITTSLRFGDDGSIVGYQGIIRDVTDRKRSEEALRESLERFRMVFEQGPLGMAISGLDYKRVAVNDTFCKMLDHTESALIEMTFADNTHPDDIQKEWENIQRLVKGETSYYKMEKRYIKKSGEIAWANLTNSAIHDRDGRLLCFLSMVEDITERKRAEEKLGRTEERLELALKGANLGLYDWNLKTGRAIWDRRSVEMLGYLPGEIELTIGGWKRLIHPEDWPEVSEALNQHLEGKRPSFEAECRFLCKSGEWRWVLSQGQITAYDTDGKPLRLTGTTQDITERKTAEQEQERLRSQLLQAQKMEALGTLAGGIAHDFNNLLTVISGYSDLMISAKCEKDQDREDLKKIQSAARTAADIVQQILAFSRKTETTLGPLDLNKQVDQLRKMLSRLIARTIEVKMNLDPDLPIVNGDPPQIDQVLINLAVNARDAMPDGGTLMIETKAVLLDEAYCRCHIEAKAGPHVHLTVRETGNGNDKASIDRIFEPFYSTKKPGQGTGLGLAMVYGIVKSHGGHIKCESEPGSGTRFSIYLPAYNGEGETDVSASGEFSALGTGTILIADDEIYVRQLGQRILEKAGYTVITATDGREALEVYREKRNQISLVILDLIMPVMDGRQCFEEILRLDPGAKVLIASGFSPDGATRETLEGRTKGFVGKPFNIKQLLKTVWNTVNKQ